MDPYDHRKLYAGTGGSGVFAMTFTPPAAASIQVTSPNGGEKWEQGSTHPITWTATGSIANVRIEYSVAGSSGPFSTIAAGAPNSGTYSWTIPSQAPTA